MLSQVSSAMKKARVRCNMLIYRQSFWNEIQKRLSGIIEGMMQSSITRGLFYESLEHL